MRGSVDSEACQDGAAVRCGDGKAEWTPFHVKRVADAAPCAWLRARLAIIGRRKSVEVGAPSSFHVEHLSRPSSRMTSTRARIAERRLSAQRGCCCGALAYRERLCTGSVARSIEAAGNQWH